MQVEFLQKQLEQQKIVYDRVEQTLKTCIAHERVSLDDVYQTMESIKMLEKYYTEEQRQILQNRFVLYSQAAEDYGKAWDNVFAELRAFMTEGVHPSNVEVQKVIQEAKRLVDIFTGGDSGIEANLSKMHEVEGGGKMLRSHGLDVTNELYDYYDKAWNAFN